MNTASLVILALVLLGAILALVKIRTDRRKRRSCCNGCAMRDCCAAERRGSGRCP